MKYSFKNLYFTNRDNINLIYDIEQNRFIQYSSKINIQHVINKLNNNNVLELNKEEEILFNYLIKIVLHDDEMQFDSFVYFKENKFVIPSASIMIAQNCNLKCKYCYGGESGRYKAKKNLFMTKEIALSSLKRIVESNSVGNEIIINFFGGEPLINYSLIKYIVKLCHKDYNDYNFTFTMTTNATLMDAEKAHFFKINNFRIMVSIDGYEEIHNKNRIFPDGEGSYEQTIKGIHFLKEEGVPFSIRATLDHCYYKQYSEISDFLETLGGDRVIISRLIHYNDDEKTFPINICELKEEKTILSEYLKKVKELALTKVVPKNFPYISYFNKIIYAKKNLINCGVYQSATAISADGKLYPCHRFVGMEGFDFGDVIQGINEEKLKRQLKSLDNNTERCKKCFARYICQRSCPRNLAKSGGKYIKYDPEYCKLLQETIDDALISYCEIFNKYPNLFTNKNIVSKIPY